VAGGAGENLSHMQQNGESKSLNLLSIASGFALLSILFGPGLGIGAIRLFIPATLFLVFVFGIYTINQRNTIMPKSYFNALAIFVFFSLWIFFAHLFTGKVNTRYFLYFYYYLFTFLVFLISFWLLSEIEKVKLTRIVTFGVLSCLILAGLEVVIGVSLISMVPLLSSDFEPGSGFWGNPNNNIVALLIFNSYLYISGSKNRYFFFSFLLIILGLMVSARIGVLMILLQCLFFIGSERALMRFILLSLFLAVSPIFIFLFRDQLMVIVVGFGQAFELFSDSQLLTNMAASGQTDSLVIRGYNLFEMLREIANFSWYEWLFGTGFGQLNLVINSSNLNRTIEYFSPHFFYLEIFVYAGFAYYAMFAFAMTSLASKLPLRSVMLLMPCFASIVAISSAVYFVPMYFLLALVCFEQKQGQLQDQKA
jgi:hypothetical protein